MASLLCLTYRLGGIRSVRLVAPVAGERPELGAILKPLAVLVRHGAGECHEAHLLATKHPVFRNDADAVRISIALATRFIDTMLAGTFMPTG
ncbi:hypothetical protein [Burkholderia lata]|uniref:hypothetical protein n=1 Tax=Burkholderia lata (strain ATCC 17760 / DSM 23089 / LMG 22485 / NCIMB 9086 / R18194 / 383) TaxID=482957 RepID=UPI001453F48A|nr:hypothetical protein [Burkholderia lata]VWC38418.1 hypothetical protein BLA15816_06878 [Burkholderia lata]